MATNAAMSLDASSVVPCNASLKRGCNLFVLASFAKFGIGETDTNGMVNEKNIGVRIPRVWIKNCFVWRGYGARARYLKFQ